MNKYLWTALGCVTVAIWVCFPIAMYLNGRNVFQLSFAITGICLMILSLLLAAYGIDK
jgi:hypothetical protein